VESNVVINQFNKELEDDLSEYDNSSSWISKFFRKQFNLFHEEN